ncbi:MAG: hypothetical protein LBI71_11340 [Enterobacteriaceae bacterium]|jgi:hypothetical protein|nr:hypothetical protein [Enterobacteriaceae bacterium]
MSLARNILLARRAINYVNDTLGVISPNQIPKTPEFLENRKQTNTKLKSLRKYINRTLDRKMKRDGITKDKSDYNIQSYKRIIPIRSAYASKYHVGNCGEKAAIAFTRLKFLGARPIEFFSIKMLNDTHSIIVIGRISGDRLNPSTWNRDAVICDPWDNKAYPAFRYIDKIAFQGVLTFRYRYE